MKLCWTSYQMNGLSKCTCRVLLWIYYLKKYVNIFERIEIEESIYESVVEPFYKKSTIEYANCAGKNRQIRGYAASSKIYSLWVNVIEITRKSVLIDQS